MILKKIVTFLSVVLVLSGCKLASPTTDAVQTCLDEMRHFDQLKCLDKSTPVLIKNGYVLTLAQLHWGDKTLRVVKKTTADLKFYHSPEQLINNDCDIIISNLRVSEISANVNIVVANLHQLYGYSLVKQGSKWLIKEKYWRDDVTF